MTSLFEPAATLGQGIPVDLVMRGGRDVSLLTFLPEQAPADEPEFIGPEFVADERAAQTAAMIEAAREQTEFETRQACAGETERQLTLERERFLSFTHEFAAGRQRYFNAAEGQVVQLALAIARRVLSREAAADPMHLTATVRAALSRVQSESASTLRVPEPEHAAWTQIFAGEETMTVLADASVAAGECVLETQVGRVELGIVPQMREVEAGFASLLSTRAA